MTNIKGEHHTMTGPDATKPCTVCHGTGRVPHAPGEYILHLTEQDGSRREYHFGDDRATPLEHARRWADFDPSVMAVVIGPDGAVVTGDDERGGGETKA
jgi:hypothetical protein